MKELVLEIIKEYLRMFPEEKEKQEKLIDYIENHNNVQITDWNNFDGHIVASGFIYAKKEKKFLVLFHKDMGSFVYPGGHVDLEDENPLEAAKREVKEETGLTNFKELKISDNELVPIDIDTHIIGYNARLNLPEHYHFDFRYLFVVKNISNISIDKEESAGYKWIDINEFDNNENYKYVLEKIKNLLDI